MEVMNSNITPPSSPGDQGDTNKPVPPPASGSKPQPSSPSKPTDPNKPVPSSASGEKKKPKRIRLTLLQQELKLAAKLVIVRKEKHKLRRNRRNRGMYLLGAAAYSMVKKDAAILVQVLQFLDVDDADELRKIGTEFGWPGFVPGTQSSTQDDGPQTA